LNWVGWLAAPALLIMGTLAAAQEVAPDFQLLDVNSTSMTFNQLVSPRDYLEQVSGWYFGHAT
jgi:hypothetical protein